MKTSKKTKKSSKKSNPKKSKATVAAEAAEGKLRVATVAREMILKGKADEEVLDALIELFPDFDVDGKKYYPGWYRAQLVRQGKLSKRQANATRHKQQQSASAQQH